jgi:hypothetical protein
MVGAIKRFLGIDVLERENLRLARSSISAHARIGQLEVREGKTALEMREISKRLTAEAEKPKIIAKPSAPKRVNWRQAREALENRDSPEEV